MRAVQKYVLCFFVLLALVAVASAQMPPNLENGFKNWGSYDSTKLDTVNTLNGNQMLHAPLLPNYPQRGGSLTMQSLLYQTSKSWQASCSVDFNGQVTCQWAMGRQGVNLRQSEGLTIQRTMHQNDSGTGQLFYKAYAYSLEDTSGATHQMFGTGPLDSTGESTKFDAIDTSGYHLEMSNPDTYGVMTTATITDRQGSQYITSSWFGGTDTGPSFCPQLPGNHLPPGRLAGGQVEPMVDDTPMGQQDCPQTAYAEQVTDRNGNRISNLSTGPLDTLGRTFAFFNGGTTTTNYDGCATGHTNTFATFQNYTAPDGTTRQMKLCYANFPIATAFNVPGIVELTGVSASQLSTVILADNTKWTFDYDSYGEILSVGLPTGGSITYTWTTIAFPSCNAPDGGASRAVATRTLNDNMGNSFKWTYTWGTVVNHVISNTVTDPLNNDTVHTFTALDGGCSFYETETQSYQGTGSSRHLLKQVDTTYSHTLYALETVWGGALGDVVPTSIQTTIYPSGKVSLVQKTYTPPTVAGGPISGTVATEKDYDWGASGPLLRETDTVYQWQKNSAYLTANMLDLPASVVVVSPNSASNIKSGCPINASGGTANCMAETDYAYDEPGYLTASNINTQHFSPPNTVRGNLTTISRWLNTSSSLVSSHTNWYDTGEVYKSIDPLGHPTTYTYDSFYAGAYATQTCSPTTGSVAHCVSGTYDFNTGVLTSLTNENATRLASGNSQGDPGHTSIYGYDYMFRLTSAQAPPDPANGGSSALTNFNFSLPNAFPLTVQRTKPITTALTDSATSYFDGLGRGYESQHVLPGGTSTIVSTLDFAGRPAVISNPYFSPSDSTYGTTTTQFDGLDRAYSVKKQDGSVSSVAYSVQTTIAVNGDCTITTDEAGNQRGACSDALGRLVEVDEPNPGATMNANYRATLLTDGNFVLENAIGTGVWSTGTYGTNAGPIYIQDDGNLVLYLFKWQAGTYATPSPGPFPTQGCGVSNYLMINQRLNGNQCIISPHGQYLLFMGTDGNLFIYDLAHNVGTWWTGTSGHPGAYAIMQGDGNLCVYTATNTYLWCSGTSGTYAERVNMEDDGRIIIYKSVWNSGTGGQPYGPAIAHPGCDVGNSGLGTTGILGSGTCLVSPNGRFDLLMQGDGNLVVYDLSVIPNKALWSTGTAISPADPGYAMRTIYSYDALGNLLRVDQKGTAPNDSTQWRTRTFAYDSLSRLTTAINPESGTITYSYDLDGNLLQKTSPAPNQTGTATQTVSYCYDALHRVTGKGYGAQSCPLTTPVVTYAYDSGTNAIGHLTSLTDQAGTASYTYDILGRLAADTRSIVGVSKNTSYTYNLNGSVKTLTYPSGRVVTYTPGAGGLLTSAVDGNGTNYVTSANYNAGGSLISLLNGSTPALNQNFQYTPRLQLCRITTLTTGALPTSCTDSQNIGNIMDRGYDFHAGNGIAGSGSDNGNVFAITNYRDTTRSQAFTYDALNRLTAGWSSANTGAYSWGENYSIDAWGNLQISPMSGKAHGGTFQLSGNAQNRPTGLAYDAAGNLMSYLSSTYTYDQENRLSSTAGMSYTYDGNGERVLKSNTSTGATVKRYWSMGGNTLAEGDGAGNLTAEYIYFGGKRIARIDLPANTVHYYLSDHLGSTSVVVSAAGTIEEESDYYPFGTEVIVTGPGVNELKFTGKRRDAESQLDYFGARYYSNVLARWTSPDWSQKPEAVPYSSLGNPQSLNQYSYVLNNPLSKVDADGHESLKPQDWSDDKPKPTPKPTSSAQNPAQAQGQKQPEKQQAKHGLTIGVGLAGNAEAGAGPVGAQVSGSAIVAASISSDLKPSVGVAVTGSAVDATPIGAIAAPKQEAAPGIGGAYAGGGVALVAGNTASVKGLEGPFQTVAGNVGGGQGASFSLSFDHSGNFVVQVTLGPGAGVSGWSVTRTHLINTSLAG